MSRLLHQSLRRLAVLSSLILFSAATAHEIKSLKPEIAAEYQLDPAFYTKTTMVQDILIATSNEVPDVVHKEAAYLFDRMMKDLKPPIAQRIRDQKVLCLLVGHEELTSDLPEFKSDKTGKELDFYNWRQRGFLTKVKGRNVVLFAEEDVMEYEGGMQIESILIHEFGHVIHGAGFDEELNKRWTRTFINASTMGLWNDGRAAQRFRRITGYKTVSLLDELIKAFPDQPSTLLQKCLNGGDILVNGKPTTTDVNVTGKDKILIVFGGKKRCYAAKNRAEYFAEGVQCWYNTNRTMDHDHNHIHTRDQIKAYDPVFARFLADILGDNKWSFASPRDRAGEGHLKNYDPSSAPVAKESEDIRIAGLEFFDQYWKEYWQRLHLKYPVAGN